MGVARGKLERCLFVHELHLTVTIHCAKRAALDKFCLHNTKLVVIERCEALNPRVLMVYLGFEYHSVQEPERRGFAVKPTAKYVDERLNLVQLQTAKPVVTPLTHQKSAILHDETTVCARFVQSCGWRLWSETGSSVRDKSLSYKLASPTLAHLTRALKFSREPDA